MCENAIHTGPRLIKFHLAEVYECYFAFATDNTWKNAQREEEPTVRLNFYIYQACVLYAVRDTSCVAFYLSLLISDEARARITSRTSQLCARSAELTTRGGE